MTDKDMLIIHAYAYCNYNIIINKETQRPSEISWHYIDYYWNKNKKYPYVNITSIDGEPDKESMTDFLNHLVHSNIQLDKASEKDINIYDKYAFEELTHTFSKADIYEMEKETIEDINLRPQICKDHSGVLFRYHLLDISRLISQNDIRDV